MIIQVQDIRQDIGLVGSGKMPNKTAKQRKQERRAKNDYLQKHGRTPAQIARKKKRNNG